MPYQTNEDLPDPITRHLPPHAQDIYRAAFNNAFAAYAGDPRQEKRPIASPGAPSSAFT
jgi:cation transport regulator